MEDSLLNANLNTTLIYLMLTSDRTHYMNLAEQLKKDAWMVIYLFGFEPAMRRKIHDYALDIENEVGSDYNAKFYNFFVKLNIKQVREFNDEYNLFSSEEEETSSILGSDESSEHQGDKTNVTQTHNQIKGDERKIKVFQLNSDEESEEEAMLNKQYESLG